MADTVKRIEEGAFNLCMSLIFVRLSTNLEYIGEYAFRYCKSLTSIFIPPSCREIDNYAFETCDKLIIFHVPQHTRLGDRIFANTELYEVSPFEEVDRFGNYRNNDQVYAWVRDLNANNQEYALHRACCSFNPLLDTIYQIV